METTEGLFTGLFEFLIWAKWLILLAIILAIADAKFGIDAANFRKEQVKISKAVRTTFSKMSGYLLWIALAYTFGQAFGLSFGVDMLPLLMLLTIFCVEIESIYVNFYAARGKKVKVDLLKFFRKKTEVIDIEEEKESSIQ